MASVERDEFGYPIGAPLAEEDLDLVVTNSEKKARHDERMRGCLEKDQGDNFVRYPRPKNKTGYPSSPLGCF